MTDKMRLKNLTSEEYEHPFDRAALNALDALPALDTVLQWFSGIWEEPTRLIELTSSAIKINYNHFPQIYRLFVEAAEILEMNPSEIDVFLTRGELNAFAAGQKDHTLILMAELVELMDDVELQCVIGHELGHMRSNHMLYKTLGDFLGSVGYSQLIRTVPLGGLVEIAIRAINIPLRHWSRMAELTCDRAGLLVAQDLDVATRVEIKLAGAPKKFADQINFAAWREQEKAYENLDYDTISHIRKLAVLTDILHQTGGSTHPFGVVRTAQLRKWVEDGSYDRVLRRETSGATPRVVEGAASCPFCGAALLPEYQFCRRCGKARPDACLADLTAAPAFCISCGAPLTPEFRFCRYCGVPNPGAGGAAAQLAPNFCIQCGMQITRGNRFCPDVAFHWGVAYFNTGAYEGEMRWSIRQDNH